MSRPIFWKSKEKTDASFLDAVKRITKKTFNTTTESKNWLSNNGYWTNYPLAVGDKAFGGIVGYIYKPTDSGYIDGEIHGIIVSENDISTKEWGCLETSASGTSIGTGLQNTLVIVNDCEEELDIAARFCYDLTTGGYNDWFLPSWIELHELMINKNLIGGFLNDYWYWSSTENSSNKDQAILIRGSEPVISAYVSKTSNYLTRAVRYF